MPSLKTYDLFISHAWTYSAGYYKLIGLLDAASNFAYRDYSVPKHDPAIDPNTEGGRIKLTRALRNQIRPVNCVLILAGMYASYRYWIQKEIELAQEYGKPIVGLVPRGQTRTPQNVQDAADEMVAWSTASVVSAIRRRSI